MNTYNNIEKYIDILGILTDRQTDQTRGKTEKKRGENERERERERERESEESPCLMDRLDIQVGPFIFTDNVKKNIQKYR